MSNAPDEKVKNGVNENKSSRPLVIGFLLVVIALGIFMFPNSKENKELIEEYGKIEKICEVATLKCYYHNVLRLEEEPDGLFKYGLFEFGKKTLWLEYEAYVKIGVKNGIEITHNKKNNEVHIYIPEAQVLECGIVDDSMKEPIEDNGWFTSITAKEKLEAYALAKEKIIKSANEDNSLKAIAYESARKKIAQEIVDMGKKAGKSYTIIWVDKE